MILDRTGPKRLWERYISPGQARLQAGVVLGLDTPELVKPCTGQTGCRRAGVFGTSPRVFRPVGAYEDLMGRFSPGRRPSPSRGLPWAMGFRPVGARGAEV